MTNAMSVTDPESLGARRLRYIENLHGHGSSGPLNRGTETGGANVPPAARQCLPAQYRLLSPQPCSINRGGGWELSPVFDVVPYLGRKRHICAPGAGFSTDCDPQAAYASYGAFGLTHKQAEGILDDVRTAVTHIPVPFDRREVCRADREFLRMLETR
jgi:hypothetical protein